MSRNKPFVVLVQPDADNREMYADYMLLCGFQVAATGDPEYALARAREADVIITGIRVSGAFDGIELVRRLRADDRTKDKAIVVLTAVTLRGEPERAHQAGCDALLYKPCLPEALVSEVRRVLSLRSIPRPRPAHGQAKKKPPQIA